MNDLFIGYFYMALKKTKPLTDNSQGPIYYLAETEGFEPSMQV
jgi:hypothetical protein